MTTAASQITLGILAGGRATPAGRHRQGLARARRRRRRCVRWQRRFAGETAAVLVSANRDLDRYARIGLRAVADRIAGDLGPLAGLDALARACDTPWLLTLPVDLVGVNDCLLPTPASPARRRTAPIAVDDDGPQPLVALWPVAALRVAAAQAHRHAATSPCMRCRRALGMAAVRFDGVRFGNLNTPDDLAAAGIVPRIDAAA